MYSYATAFLVAMLYIIPSGFTGDPTSWQAITQRNGESAGWHGNWHCSHRMLSFTSGYIGASGIRLVLQGGL